MKSLPGNNFEPSDLRKTGYGAQVIHRYCHKIPADWFDCVRQPPGLGCLDIAILSNMKYPQVVIEPTMANLHDTKRVIEMIYKFYIRFGIWYRCQINM